MTGEIGRQHKDAMKIYEIKEKMVPAKVYQCAYPGCTFEGKSEHAVKAHYAAIHCVKRTERMQGCSFLLFESKSNAELWFAHHAPMILSAKDVKWEGPGWYWLDPKRRLQPARVWVNRARDGVRHQDQAIDRVAERLEIEDQIS